MTSASRVMNAIRRIPGTPVPRGELTIDREFALDLLDWRANDEIPDAISDTDLIIGCCQALKLDLVCVQSGGSFHERSDLSTNLPDIGRITGEGIFVFWIVNGAFQTAITRQGMMKLMADIARSPGGAGDEMRRLTDEIITIMDQGVTACASGIIIADDIAYNKNTYVPPDFVERHLLPVWKAQVTAAGDLGVPVFFHSDGNLNAVLPYIVEAGFDGLHGIEPASGMDLRQIKRTYGEDLCLMGNIDPSLLSVADIRKDTETRHAQLRQAVTDLITSAGGNGGLIFGTCSGLQAGMSPELVHLMYRLASEPDITSQASSS
jgi:uroporphyrinogen decarboxylase